MRSAISWGRSRIPIPSQADVTEFPPFDQAIDRRPAEPERLSHSTDR
jgi:hypothetical protein